MDNWQLAGIIGGALVTVIGVFWKLHLGNVKETKDRLSNSEEKNEENTQVLIAQGQRLAKLEGSQEGMLLGVDKVISEVLEEIRDSRK